MTKILKKKILFVLFFLFILIIISFLFILKNTNTKKYSENIISTPKNELSDKNKPITLLSNPGAICPFPVEEYNNLSDEELEKFDENIAKFLSIVSEPKDNCNDYLSFLSKFFKEGSWGSAPMLVRKDNDLLVSVLIDFNVPLTSKEPVLSKIGNNSKGIMISSNGYYRLTYRYVNASELINLAQDERIDKIRVTPKRKMYLE
ncbi:MAG: hypothetical protein PF488_01960 [Patescibacteria group bacterium]|jgi:hypothetical protein|nr:hypothetical protein [Patescibacteria group bacterium]